MASAGRPSYGREQVDTSIDRPRLSAPAAVRRISWGAIFAGIAVVLVTQLLLMLLGLAIGASTLDPATSNSPTASTFGVSTAVWWVISTAIAIFAGAWVAGRLAGMPTRTDGMLHGVVTWAAATLLGLYLLTSTIGSLVGGAFGVLGNVASTVGQSASSLTQGALQVLPDEIRGQAEGLFDQAPAAAGQAQQQVDQARQAAGGGNTADAVQRVVRGVREGASPQDRQAAVNVISQQAGIPPQEAEQRLNQFQNTYQQYTTQAAEQARQTAEATANTVSQVSFWSVVALLLGAVLSAVAGGMGTPRDLRLPV
jgi:hypothetical protein